MNFFVGKAGKFILLVKVEGLPLEFSFNFCSVEYCSSRDLNT